MQLQDFTIEAVQPHLGSAFRVTREDGSSVDVRFDSVTPLMENADRTRLKRQPFSMAFSGPAEAFLPQKTYTVSHPVLGEDLILFLVPIERHANGYVYESVFT
jgi:hypothetical protein